MNKIDQLDTPFSRLIQKSELNGIIDAFPHSLIVVNADGIVLNANRKTCDMFSSPRKEFIGKQFTGFFVEEMMGSFFIEEMISTGKTDQTEVLLQTAHGILPCLLTGNLMRKTENGDEFVIVATDISELKKTQDRLEAERIKADNANKSKSLFLANMSHEIRTPLNGIMGLNSLLLETELNTDQKDMSQMVQQSAETLFRLINDILDFSKIEAGKLEIENIAFAVSDLFNSINSITAYQVQEKGLELEIQIDASIPGILMGDVTRIRQVLLNMLSNAIKFTNKGKIILSAILHDEDEDKVEVKFSVRDSGIGIPIDKQEIIFEAFSQADASTTRQFGGTGLGLSISRRLVWLMGGEMQLYSREGQGSTFSFTLPMEYDSNEQKGSSGPEIELDMDFSMMTDTPRILLVEDNPINTKVAVRLLEKKDYDVETATNGKEALEKISQQSYDLILMDVQMPVMDGLTAARAIRELEENSDVPIVALTANAMKGDMEKCIDAGMNDYVAKPIRPDELYDAISRMLKS